MLIEQLRFNYPIYSKMSLTTKYERVLTVFLDDVSYEFIKQFSLINNIVTGELLLCHVCTSCNTNESTSTHTTEQVWILLLTQDLEPLD